MPEYIKPLSWSEVWLYQNRPDEYYSQYILGIPQEPSREMLLGSIIHAGFEGQDWLKLLKDNNFTADYERNVGEIMKFNLPVFPEKEVWLGEKGKFYEETDCPIASKADGRDKEKNLLLEIKTGKNFWTQDMVDATNQITLYSFMYWKDTGKIPETILISCNVNNGKVKMFPTNRTEKRMLDFCEEIKNIVKELKEKKWWNQRISSYQKI